MEPDENKPEIEHLPVFERTRGHFYPHPVVVLFRWRLFAGKWFIGVRKLYSWECTQCRLENPWTESLPQAKYLSESHSVNPKGA